jgi:hypothetical protein
VAVLALCGQASVAQQFPSDGAFIAGARPLESAATVSSALGGEWLYRVPEPAADGRIRQRFTIGKPVRTEYSLFTGQEEAALWETREKLLRPAPPPIEHHRGQRKTAAMPVAIDWPKVQVSGDRTCVPAAGYSQAPDWLDHKICWNKGTRHVD